MTNLKLKESLNIHRFSILAALYFAAIVLIISRLDFGFAGYPEGTNILDSYLVFYHYRTQGIFPWYSLTDWGQPFPGFTGPTLLNLIADLIPISVALRIIEMVSIFLSGFLMYFILGKVIKRQVPALLAGTYYMLMTETPQFFDGHLGLMITFALVPVFYYFLYNLVFSPSIKNSVLSAITLYLLLSVGDIGAFYMLCIAALPPLLYLLARKIRNSGINRRDISCYGLSTALFFTLILTWIVPYLYGARPQFTTNITANILSFGKVAGVLPLYSFSGLVGDVSYTTFYLQNPTYSIFSAPYYAIYLAVPVLLFVYFVFFKKKIEMILLLLYSFLFALISTAALVPGISGFNEFLYLHVPLFNYIPALFRWNFFTILIYSFLISIILADFFDFMDRRKLKTEDIGKKDAGAKRIGIYTILRSSMFIKIVVVIILGFTIVSQNFEIFSSPPTTFEFPQEYTGAYTYISNQTGNGYVMLVPFGGIGSRSQWGGISASPELMSSAISGRNIAIFAGGNPYSLALDSMIGYGEAHGLTNNISKFLSSDNIGYIAITNYSNWAYSSDRSLNPVQSYNGILAQKNLGNLVYSSGNQSVYELNNHSSPLYYTHSYYVYFGGDALLYELSNSPFYNFTTALVAGNQLGSNFQTTLRYSSGLLMPESYAVEHPQLMLLASTFHVPLTVFLSNFTGQNGLFHYRDLWNASNGIAYLTSPQGGYFSLSPPFSSNETGNYNMIGVSSRLSLPPFSSASVNYGNQEFSTHNIPSIHSKSPVDRSILSNASARINNQGKYAYNGSVSLEGNLSFYYLNWNFSPRNDTYQSFLISAPGFGTDSGFYFNASTVLPQLLVAQFDYNNKFYQTSLPQVINYADGTSTFYVPYGFFRSSYQNLTDSNTLPSINIGFEHTANLSELKLSGFHTFNTSAVSSGKSGHFDNFRSALSYTGIKNPVSFTFQGNGSLDFTSVTFVNSTRHESAGMIQVSYVSSDHAVTFKSAISGPGLLVYTQTYSSQWILSAQNGSMGIHMPVNVGLNGWLLTGHGNTDNLTILYTGYNTMMTSLIVMIVLLAFYSGIFAIVYFYRRMKT